MNYTKLHDASGLADRDEDRRRRDVVWNDHEGIGFLVCDADGVYEPDSAGS
jgi:hypothetical protein